MQKIFCLQCNIFFKKEAVADHFHLLQVPRIEKRVNTVAKLGYKKCIVPKAAEKSLPTLEDMNIEIVGCRNMKEVINTVFV